MFLTVLTSKSLSRAGVVQILASSSVPRLSAFNDFDFQIAFARRRGAISILASSTSQSAPADFDFQIAFARRRRANFVDVNFQKCSRHASL